MRLNEPNLKVYPSHGSTQALIICVTDRDQPANWYTYLCEWNSFIATIIDNSVLPFRDISLIYLYSINLYFVQILLVFMPNPIWLVLFQP